jgi:hypothetical protein
MTRHFALLLVVGCLAGCMSVPMSTLWKLRNFSIDQFLALDPNALRAAVLTDARARYGSVVLEVTAEWKGKPPQRYDIVLKPEPAPDPRLASAPARKQWTVFALDPDGIAAFEGFRRSLSAARQSEGRIEIGIGLRGSEVPPDLARALPVRVDLLLVPQDGYFTMMRETIVDTTRLGDNTSDTRKAR